MKYFFEVGQSYTEVTPESCEQGDVSDSGWEVEKSNEWTLRDILRELEKQGIEHVSVNKNSLDVYGWFSTICYETGTEKQLCLHIDGNERNIKRILKLIEVM